MSMLSVRGAFAPPGQQQKQQRVCSSSGWKAVRISSLRPRWADGRCRIAACAAPCEVSVGELSESTSTVFKAEGLVFQEGRTPELIRAAAYLRALSFYTYPEGRNEESLKVQVAPEDEDGRRGDGADVQSGGAGARLQAHRVRSGAVPALLPRRHVRRRPPSGLEGHVVWRGACACGVARLEPGPNPAGRNLWHQTPGHECRSRAGVSFQRVCGAAMRQRGFGVALLQRAQEIAQLWGITNLYVHGVVTNEAAVKLYGKGGFVLESEESASDARRQARPRRSLLHKFI